MARLQLYSQRDTRWANVPLTPSKQTIARAGCVVTSIAMLASYYNWICYPPGIVLRTKFTDDGLILWNTLKLYGLTFYERDYTADHRKIAAHIRDPRLAVILQVNRQTHWVLATGFSLLGRGYKIADPIDGRITTTARYKNDITGAAYFKAT